MERTLRARQNRDLVYGLLLLYRHMSLSRDEQWDEFSKEAEVFWMTKAKQREASLVRHLKSSEEELQATQDAFRSYVRTCTTDSTRVSKLATIFDVLLRRRFRTVLSILMERPRSDDSDGRMTPALRRSALHLFAMYARSTRNDKILLAMSFARWKNSTASEKLVQRQSLRTSRGDQERYSRADTSHRTGKHDFQHASYNHEVTQKADTEHPTNVYLQHSVQRQENMLRQEKVKRRQENVPSGSEIHKTEMQNALHFKSESSREAVFTHPRELSYDLLKETDTAPETPRRPKETPRRQQETSRRPEDTVIPNEAIRPNETVIRLEETVRANETIKATETVRRTKDMSPRVIEKLRSTEFLPGPDRATLAQYRETADVRSSLGKTGGGFTQSPSTAELASPRRSLGVPVISHLHVNSQDSSSMVPHPTHAPSVTTAVAVSEKFRSMEEGSGSQRVINRSLSQRFPDVRQMSANLENRPMETTRDYEGRSSRRFFPLSTEAARSLSPLARVRVRMEPAATPSHRGTVMGSPRGVPNANSGRNLATFSSGLTQSVNMQSPSVRCMHTQGQVVSSSPKGFSSTTSYHPSLHTSTGLPLVSVVQPSSGKGIHQSANILRQSANVYCTQGPYTGGYTTARDANVRVVRSQRTLSSSMNPAFNNYSLSPRG